MRRSAGTGPEGRQGRVPPASQPLSSQSHTQVPPFFPGKRYRGVATLTLPPPLPVTASLDGALRARLSCRRFDGGPISLQDLASLLGGAYGVGDAVAVRGLDAGWLRQRPVPSAGNAYPLEIYLLIRAVAGVEPGTYHFDAAGHRLERIRGPVPWPRTVALCQGQPYVAGASALVVLSAVLDRTLPRYGDRGRRFVLLEAGHLGQNLYLLAAALGLGCLAVGGADDAALAAILDLDPGREPPLYALAIGRPSTTDRARARDLVQE